MIRKIILYIKQEGMKNTMVKVFERILKLMGIKKSETYFLLNRLDKKSNINMDNDDEIEFKFLTYNMINEYEKMKFFSFIDTNKWMQKGSKVLIAVDNKKIIGYAWIHFNPKHNIHSLGNWDLQKDEAWIGPTFVNSEYRNRGINKKLLIRSLNELKTMDISKCYTAINADNTYSIASFVRVGFSVIGKVITKNQYNSNLLELHSAMIMQKKYNT